MEQLEFSVAGATGNLNASVTAQSAVSSRIFLLAPVSPRCALSRLSRKGLLAV